MSTQITAERFSSSKPTHKTARLQPVNFTGLPRSAIIRLPDVLRIIPVGRSKWLRGVSVGDYPKSVRIARRAVGWKYGELLDLLDRMAAGEIDFQDAGGFERQEDAA